MDTAVPPHRLSQERARDRAAQMFAGAAHLERLLGIFESSGVRTRFLGMPPEWYLRPRGFAEKNAAWACAALALAEEAARKALEDAAIPADRLSAIVLASTTGIATPSLGATLVQRLGLPRDASRLPLWGLGCAGGSRASREPPSSRGAGARPCSWWPSNCAA